MFEGSRLSYIVPGYTGHQPTQLLNDPIQIPEKQPKYQIPGYQGFISGIQSENIFSNTYGKITYNISKNDYHKGQDVPRESRYNSIQQTQYVNQGQVLQRSAAEIVGVNPQQPRYNVTVDTRTGRDFWGGNPESTKTVQGFEYRDQPEQQAQRKQISESQSNFFGDDKKEPLKIGQPLPGYTGVIKRVTASNIFGQTYANSMVTAKKDENSINSDKKLNFRSQAQQIPPIRR